MTSVDCNLLAAFLVCRLFQGFDCLPMLFTYSDNGSLTYNNKLEAEKTQQSSKFS